MEARQEVRLKEAEAADQKRTANRDTFAEPTACIIGTSDGKVEGKTAKLADKNASTAVTCLIVQFDYPQNVAARSVRNATC